MPDKALRPRLTRRKKWLFSSLVLMGIVLFMELVSLVGLWGLEGQVDFDTLHYEQDQIAESETLDNAPPEVIHPYLGWVINPLVHKGINRGDKHIPVNDFGFLGAGSPLRKRSRKKFIIGIVGGSVAQQFAEQGAETLEKELKQTPRFRDREIEFVGLALGGYKQPQQLFVLMYLLTLGGEFDAVINIDGYNETALHPAENGHHDVFPAFPRAWFHRIQEHPDPRNVPVRNHLWATKITRQQWAGWFSRLGYRYSPTLNFVWVCRDRYLDRLRSQDVETLMSSRLKDKREYLKTGPLRKYENDAAMYADLIALWKECSRQMAHVCRANGIEYYQVLQPNQYLEASKPMEPQERQIAIYEGSEYGQAAKIAYPMLIEGGAELKLQGIRFLDLTQLFAKVNDPIYIDNCCHYNQQGDDLLAEAIARAMADSTPVGK